MIYRSISDLSNTIRNHLYKIPEDIDLVVGIPRSGMLAANILALNLNLRFCDIDSFIDNTPLAQGVTRKSKLAHLAKPDEAKHVLIVDDSVQSGRSMAAAREKILRTAHDKRITFCAIYVSPHSISCTDIFLEIIEPIRFFEWHALHRPFLSKCCVDIDGVICVDPTDLENDDGPRYRGFLENGKPLLLPSYPVGYLVTSRLEKYRDETEAWLRKHGVEYRELHMLDLPDAATRRRLGCHAAFKASVFKSIETAELFIESDDAQAREIAALSGKHVLSFAKQYLYQPRFSRALVEKKVTSTTRRITRGLQGVMKKWRG